MALLGLILLAQLLVPLMTSVASQSAGDGRYVAVCTLQGLQQILISDADGADTASVPTVQDSSECPLCSLTNLYTNALATLFPDTPKDPSQQGYPLPSGETAVFNPPVYKTPARAPPLV